MHGMTSKAHELVHALKEIGSVKDGDGVIEFYGRLKKYTENSAKFLAQTDSVVPAMVETGEVYLDDELWALPFDLTLFEFVSPAVRYFVLCSRTVVEDIRTVVNFDRLACYFVPFRMDGQGHIGVSGLSGTLHFGQQKERVTIYQPSDVSPKPDAISLNYMYYIAALVTGVVPLLGVHGVTADIVTPPERLNRRRIRRGKLPLYEHRIIKIGGISKAGHVLGVGSKHASPRMHWRRGHVRTLGSGKKIPIAAMLVNKGGRGFISHDYEVQ